jgi:Zn-dependent protease
LRLDLFLLYAPILLLSMVAHEYAHGYAALKQGDPTAYQLGRLTWNPVKHIDPFMTILLPLMTWFGSGGSFVFGGAKPVPVVPRNYRNFKRGDIIVSMAGIVTNLALAVLATLLIVPLGLLGRGVPALMESCAILQEMLKFGIVFNLLLAIFNLLPVPPLDGSHVMKYLLPPKWGLQYQALGRYGLVLFLLLLTVGRPILTWWLSPVMGLRDFALGVVFPYILPSQLLA